MKKYRYRNEIKYRINRADAALLKKLLALVTYPDKYAYYPDGSYLIKSLYFDDPDSNAYYEKKDGILYRTKYRIRIYNNSDKLIKLEKKMKHNNLTAKEAQVIKLNTYYDLVNGNYASLNAQEGSLLKEFIDCLKYRQLRPSIIVSYQRLAFIYPVSDVRITIDYQVQSGRYNTDLFARANPTFLLDESDKWILEVKFNEVLPSQIATVLGSIPLCREAISKFALCRSIK